MEVLETATREPSPVAQPVQPEASEARKRPISAHRPVIVRSRSKSKELQEEAQSRTVVAQPAAGPAAVRTQAVPGTLQAQEARSAELLASLRAENARLRSESLEDRPKEPSRTCLSTFAITYSRCPTATEDATVILSQAATRHLSPGIPPSTLRASGRGAASTVVGSTSRKDASLLRHILLPLWSDALASGRKWVEAQRYTGPKSGNHLKLGKIAAGLRSTCRMKLLLARILLKFLLRWT
eukprot:s3819_g7.t1